MCDLLKPVEAVEYKGKLYRSSREAAAAAIHDIGVEIHKHGLENIGKSLMANAAKLVPLFEILYPQEKAAPSEANHPIADKPVYPEGGEARGDKPRGGRKPTPSEKRADLFGRLADMWDDISEARTVIEILKTNGGYTDLLTAQKEATENQVEAMLFVLDGE